MNPKTLFLLAAVLLLLFPGWIAAQDTQVTTAFSILRSSGDGIDIHFTMPQWSLETTDTQDDAQSIKLADTPYLFIDEKETLPVFSTMIAIPYSGGASLSILGSAADDRDGITLDFDSALSNERLTGRYQDSLYPAQDVVLS